MPRVIPDDGPRNARIVLCGEMDAAAEVQQHRHFVGPAGQLLARWLAGVGLQRGRDLYVTNVVPYRHNDKNDIKLVPRDELDDWTRQLHERLAALTDPWLLVPTGNTALRALTGKVGITKHRGSIYGYTDANGRSLKVIPTLHPAALFRQPSWERRCLADWRRVSSDAQFRELRLPERHHAIKPILADLADFVTDARRHAEVLVFDIETPRKRLWVEGRTLKSGAKQMLRRRGPRRMTCIGFSFEPGFSLTIPTTASYWGAELPQVFDLIRQLLALPCAKGAQNHLFDCWWLAQYGIDVHNFVWDTRWMSHCCDPLDAHDLAYQASVHTREPYWKDDTKEKNDDADPDAGSIETFWRYNGKDCAVTRELVDVQRGRLEAAGRDRFYREVYARLYAPMAALGLGGVRVDDAARRRTATKLTAESLGIQDRLAALAGEDLTGPKGDFSTKKLTHFLYDTLRIPAQHDRKTGNLTANEVTVRRLMLKHPAKLGEAGPLILRYRRLSALSRFVSDTVADADGRMRSQWGFTETLRFTAGKTPRGTGANSQNTDRELLHLLLPEPGHVLLEVDLSQAEDRVVKMLTGAERLFERARAKPWDNDEHRRAASLIFNVREPDVTKEQRYLAKRARHASNYGMQGKTLSDQLLKDGLVYTPEQCDAFIATILDQDTPEVRDWQRAVRQQVLRDRCLTNAWGFVVDCTYERLGDDLYRQMYAWRPQSEVGMLTKLWGLLPLTAWIAERGSAARIVGEKHDSLLVSVPPGEAWDLSQALRASLERPRRYNGHDLTIWAEVKLGRNAAMQREWKQWPEREEFEEVARCLLT